MYSRWKDKNIEPKLDYDNDDDDLHAAWTPIIEDSTHASEDVLQGEKYFFDESSGLLIITVKQRNPAPRKKIL
jgi:hypothetical protein